MDTPFSTIVAGVASVADGGTVLARVAALARSTGAHLHLVHSYEFADPVEDAYDLLGYGGSDTATHYRATLQEQLERLAASASVPEDTRCSVIEGHAPAVLCGVAEQERADLIVVGATHRHGISHFLGSTAEQVVRDAPAPVLVMRAPFSPPLSRILFALDLSDFSEVVREYGTLAVRSLGAREPSVRVVLVVPFNPLMPPPMHREALEEVARVELGRFLDGRSATSPPPHGRVRFGDPADEIVAEAKQWKADLLVVGTHGRTGLSRLFLGSVEASAIRLAPCSVLVVPPVLAHRGVTGTTRKQLDLPVPDLD